MGGPGSGSAANNPTGAGRPKKMAIAVVGSGVPCPVTTLPAPVQAAFDRLTSLTAGVSFSQDSVAVELAARLMVRSSVIDDAITADAANAELHRLSLAIGRQLISLLAKFGLTPRDRQVLLVPRAEEPSADPIQSLLSRRSKSRFFSDSHKHDE